MKNWFHKHFAIGNHTWAEWKNVELFELKWRNCEVCFKMERVYYVD